MRAPTAGKPSRPRSHLRRARYIRYVRYVRYFRYIRSNGRKALAAEIASPKELLLEAAAAGDAETVAALLKDGGNANCRKEDKKRPLHRAAAGGHEKVRAVRALR